MELTACIESLKLLKKENLQENNIVLLTDSAYIANCFKQKWYKSWEKNGWRKSSNNKPVKNQEYWKSLLKLYRSLDNVEINHIKGHAGNKFNEMADSLAVAAAEDCSK